VTTGDIEALHAQYLFLLAHLCHLSRDDVGGLTLADFANYTDSIDDYLKTQKAG
jgi:hypothetical protein